MLQKMRDQTQSLGFKILVGLIIVVLAVFGFGAFNLFIDADPEAATVNGEDITVSALQLEIEREKRRLAGQLGENFNPDLLDNAALRDGVLERLVSRALLVEATRAFGLGVSQDRLNRRILDDPNFQSADGAFNEDQFRMVIRSMGFTPVSFNEELREASALDHLRSGFVDTAFLLDWERRALAALTDQKRDIAYLTFDPAGFESAVTITDDDVAAHFDENRLDYMTEETVDVDYVTLTLDDLLDDPQIEVTDDDVQATYDREREDYAPQERRRASHILIGLNDERDEAEALDEARAVREELVAGAPFEDLARERSDDPGSAASGGDLGFAGKGVFVPEFEQALWALEPGEISEPVATQFGVHVIRLEEVEMPTYPSFEDRRGEIETKLRRSRAQELMGERLREMDTIAFEQPSSLEPLVDAFALTVERVESVSRNTGGDVFSSADLRDAVFDAEVIDDGNNSAAITLDDELVVVARVAEHYPSAQKPLDEVSDAIRAALVREAASDLADESLVAAFERLSAGEATGSVANDYGLQWQTVEKARRNQPTVPRSVLTEAFDMPRPDPGNKSIATDAESRSIVTVTQVWDGDVSLMTEAELNGLDQSLSRRAGNLDFSALYDTLEASASISYQ